MIRRDPLGPLSRDRIRRGEERAPDRYVAPVEDIGDADRYSQEVVRFEHGSRVPGPRAGTERTKDPAEVPDPAVVDVPAELRAEILDLMSRYPDPRSASIPALAAAQRLHGWCSPDAIEQVACVMSLTPGYLTAVAGFYDMLETEPVGRRTVYVCTNISCSILGADELLARLRDDLGGDPDVNLRGFECLGACDIAPMCSVDGTYVGPVTDEEIPSLVEQIRNGTPPLPAKQIARRRVADAGANSDDVLRASADDGTHGPVGFLPADPTSGAGGAAGTRIPNRQGESDPASSEETR